MQKSRNTFLRIVNRIIYCGAASFLIAALILGMAHHTVQAQPIGDPVTCNGQLQLSDITCLASSKQVQVQFILNQVEGGTPGNSVTFTLRINGGPAQTLSAPFVRKTGSSYHYIYYGTATGYYDVTSAYVFIGTTKIYLHNPDQYKNLNNNCFVPPTPTTPVPTTETPVPTTETPVPTTETPVPTTETPVPTTETVVPTTETVVPTTETPVPTTETPVPTTETVVPTTETPVPTTETPVPTTETPVPTTETPVPTTETPVPTTETPVPTTETPVPTTETPVPTTETPVPTTETPVPTTETPVPTTPVPTTPVPTTPVPTTPVPTTPVPTTPVPTTPVPTTPVPTTPVPTTSPTNVPDSPSINFDPYCTTDGLMQWTVENPNAVPFVIEYWTLDGGPAQPGFTAAPGSTKFTATQLGTHTITLYYGESQSVSATDTLDVCPLPIPPTGGGLLIPVTGADQSQAVSDGLLFGGLAFGGLGLILSALRKLLGL